jgi:hypothetical protein
VAPGSASASSSRVGGGAFVQGQGMPRAPPRVPGSGSGGSGGSAVVEASSGGSTTGKAFHAALLGALKHANKK